MRINLSREIEGIDVNDYNDEKVLKSYIATSGYTIMALEDAIKDLKKSISLTSNLDFISIYQERLEELENHLAVITYVD